MKSQSLIVRINDLIDQHGGGFTKCTDPKCQICNEIKRLRKQLLQDEKEKPLKGVEKKLTKPLKERITKERYLQLKKRGYTDKTIAKEYGVSATAIVKWKKENLSKEELTNSFDDISTPIVNEQKPDFNKNEQEKEIECLKKEVIHAHKLVTEREETISHLQQDIKHLRGSVAAQGQKIVDETLRLQKENESLKKEIQQLKQKIKASENEKHRYFVDFMDLENEVKGLKLFAFEKLKKDVFGT